MDLWTLPFVRCSRFYTVWSQIISQVPRFSKVQTSQRTHDMFPFKFTSMKEVPIDDGVLFTDGLNHRILLVKRYKVINPSVLKPSRVYPLRKQDGPRRTLTSHLKSTLTRLDLPGSTERSVRTVEVPLPRPTFRPNRPKREVHQSTERYTRKIVLSDRKVHR